MVRIFMKKLNKKNQKKRTLFTKPKILALLLFAAVGSWLIYTSFAATTGNFKHPGVLLSKGQIDFIKTKVNTNAQPWKSAFDQMSGGFLASKNYVPKPVPKLQCTTSGLANAYPQLGCTDLNNDSAAVYTQALMWQLTGDQAYANKAVEIMNAWSSTLKEAPLDDPNGSDPKNDAEFFQNRLLLGWSAESMVRGAEIIRHSNAGWKQEDIDKFENMLRTIYYPQLSQGWTGSNNGGATWADGLVNMGVLLNDKDMYDMGIQHWKQNTRSMVYLKTDGDLPLPYLSPRDNKYKVISYYSPTQYVNGLEGETCRDMGHTFMGLGAMTNVAETAYIQGTHDLYSDPEFKERFIAGYELNAGYLNELLDYMATNNITDTTLFDDNPSSSPRNATIANWKPVNFPCNDFKVGGSSAFLGNEIALNHFSNRLNIAMPNTKKLAERKRPQKGGNHLFYETLTHANTGNAGITPTEILPPPAPLPLTTMTLNGVTQGSTVSSPIRLSAVVANAPNFDRIEFKVDGILINSDRTAPYCLSGDANGACIDYTIAAGTHIVSATLFYDTTKTIAKDVFFTVSQPPVVTPQDTTAPTPPTNITRAFRTDLANFRYVLNIKWTASQDNVGGTGIKEYQISRNGKLIGINGPTSTSFADTTIGLNIAYTYSIVAIDGATPPNASTPGTTTAKASCILVWCSIK
jgi:Alginate lyase